MSEGINFKDELGRCVVMVGLPHPNMKSPELALRYSFWKTQIAKTKPEFSSETHFADLLCMKAVNQSIGRAFRHKSMLFSALMAAMTPHCLHSNRPAW
eukprot:m.776795 g.776795  ORF g.776795 m.776795 type:complete len:98 (+) comp59121_c0_seq10:2300-2593(+)